MTSSKQIDPARTVLAETTHSEGGEGDSGGQRGTVFSSDNGTHLKRAQQTTDTLRNCYKGRTNAATYSLDEIDGWRGREEDG